MLTPPTLQKLQLEQAKLDQFIVQKKNLTDTDSAQSFIRTKVALLVEIGELANELGTFKHWKKATKINLEKAQEELIDCFHFYLSWANSFGIDFVDYKFRKLVPEPDYNELLLSLFLETGSFSMSVPWSKTKKKLLAVQEKSWEDSISKYISEGKIKEGEIEEWRAAKEKGKKQIEKTSGSFLHFLELEKNKTRFYRWLMIFEELSLKLGLKSETDIEVAYLTKNQKNWERQKQNY
jgi:dimeric dUTPase (all-alpha-NTP-PPase superfamily)